MEKKFVYAAVGLGLLILILCSFLVFEESEKKEDSLSELYSKASGVDSVKANACAEIGFVGHDYSASRVCLMKLIS